MCLLVFSASLIYTSAVCSLLSCVSRAKSHTATLVYILQFLGSFYGGNILLILASVSGSLPFALFFVALSSAHASLSVFMFTSVV